MEDENDTSDFIRTENYDAAPCEEDDTSLGEIIDEPRLVGNENESQANEEEKEAPQMGDLNELSGGNEIDDLINGRDEVENLEKMEGDEGVESLMDEISASADHEKTASLEDDMMRSMEDDADLATNGSVGDSDVSENKSITEEDDGDKEDDSAMEDEITSSIDEGLEKLEKNLFTPEAKDDLLPVTSETNTSDVLKEQNEDSEISENKSITEKNEEDKKEETQEDDSTMEDMTNYMDEGSEGLEKDFFTPEAKDDLLPVTSEENTNSVLELQNDEHEGSREEGSGKEKCYDNEKEMGDISNTEDETGEAMDEYSQASDTDNLTPRFEITDSSQFDEIQKDNVEDDEREPTLSPLDEEILPEDNNEECNMGLSEIEDVNAIPDSEIGNGTTYAEQNEDKAYAENNESPGEVDRRKKSDDLDEQGRNKNGDSLVAQSGDEAAGLENPEEQPQFENLPVRPEKHSNGDVMAPNEQDGEPQDEETGSHLEEDMSEERGDGGISGGFYADDDLSSIFSDDGRDMSTIVQENSILREAMMQLRNDNPGGFTDTVSETSDEVDDLYPYSYGGEEDSKMPTSKFMADRDLNDARMNELMREKRESQAKMRQLEREKAATERRYRQDKMERDFLQERFTLKASQLEDEIRDLKQENQRLKRGVPQGKGITPSGGNKKSENTKEPGKDFFGDNEDGSLPNKNGFAIDIAMLAKENEKLSEIIDHLQETPGNDCFSEFVDNLDKYVPKEEYIRLENEKLKLETALREKERMVKEQERMLEETKFDLEEEIEILKENLKKADNKNKEKGKILSQYDIKMMEAKAKFTEKVSKLESALDQEVSKKVKLETVIVNLKKCNENFDQEIQGMKSRMKKLQNQEVETEEKNRREKAAFEGRLHQESEEKTKLGRNVEALLQDLMQLKTKMLEEAEKHRKEKEQLRSEFDNEKSKMANAQENTMRRLVNELDEEKKRNEQLKRRMAEIPSETIVAVMENTTEAGIFESPISGIEPSLIERAIEEEQYIQPEKDNMVMAMNNHLDGDPSNVNKPLEDNTGDINKLQRKLMEVTKLNSIMQRRNKEIEEENINLKEKMERVGRDVSRLRELEDKNEELQEEIARNAKKRSEMQKKQEDMMEEIEDISKKLNKVEGNNCDLSEEVDRLTKKIKTMEQEFADEKSKLTSSLEHEKTSAVNETEKRLDEQKARSKKLESEVEDLKADIKTLKDAKRAAEEKFVNDMRELVDRHNAELGNERERYRQLQDELNNNAGTVRRVTEEWEQMLRNAVSRYEDDLQKNEDERRKLADDFQRQKEEMKSKFGKEKAKLELRIQEMERNGRSPRELDVIEAESTEFSYQSPQNDTLEDGDLGDGDLYEDKSHISNIIAEKHEKIRVLAAQKQKLEQKLEQMQKSLDEEKNDLCAEHKKEKQKLEETLTEDYKRRLEESKRYYEGLLEDQRRKHEKENEELENKFKRERQELEEKMKQGFSSNLSSRSAGLENKIQDLVSQKVQEQKEITKRVEVQMRNRMKEMQNEKNENKRKFEREKQVLEGTIQALTKELAKVKQEKKDLKKKQKKDKAEMEEAFENEKKEIKQMWEKCKLDTINQIEEEWSEKMKSEHVKSEMYKEELQRNYETKIKQMKLKFKAEKAELEIRLADAASETNSLAEAKKEIQAALEDEYRRKLQKEKENIESTLQGLRQEIGRLQEHRKQLQNQMAQRESQAKGGNAPLLEAKSQVGCHNLCW